jgi:hypothetical protein
MLSINRNVVPYLMYRSLQLAYGITFHGITIFSPIVQEIRNKQ